MSTKPGQLHFIDGSARITGVATVLAVAVPVVIYLGLLHALSDYLHRPDALA